MEFTAPSSTGYTVYTKSSCSFCLKIKVLLNDLNMAPTVINCDEYLLEAREEFLEFIKSTAGREQKTFPMVFLDGQLIGGYTDTKALLDAKSD
jgi:glutaredoxin-related protein